MEMNPREVPGYFGLLARNANFRRLWLGQVVSFFGDWFKMIALYTMVQKITDSTLAISGVMVGAMLPVFLVIPIAGPIVDRFDRRKVMLITDVARAVLALGLIAAHWLESLPLLYAVLSMMVAFSGIFIPARTAIIPQVTSEEELPVAMALSGGTWSVMLAFGAAVGGVVTATVGIDGALLMDSASYLLSFAILWRLPPLRPRVDHASDTSAGLLAGFVYLWRKPYLAMLLCVKPAMGLLSAGNTMMPIYGNGVFAVGGPLYIGLLYSTRGIGALIGSMGVRRVVGDAPETLRGLIGPSFLVMVAGLWIASVSPNMGVAGLGFLLIALGQGVAWVFSGTLAQMASDQEYRGRIFSLEFGVMTLVASVSSLGGGAAVDWGLATVREVVGVTALLVVGPALLGFIAVMALKRVGWVVDRTGKVPSITVAAEFEGDAPGHT